MLNPDQFAEAMDIVNRSGEKLIKGSDVKKVFRAVGIRSWPLEELVTESEKREFGLERQGSIRHDEPLNTMQTYLHGPTVRKYMKNPPSKDPHSPGEPYLPWVYKAPRGSKWIEEGHHRIVASRLRGDTSTDVYEGYIE